MHKKQNIYRSRKVALSHLVLADVFELTYGIFDRKTFYLEREQGKLMDVVRQAIPVIQLDLEKLFMGSPSNYRPESDTLIHLERLTLFGKNVKIWRISG